MLSVTDGINLTSRYRVETGAKVVVEDVAQPGEVSFTVGGRSAEYLQYKCKDPITAPYEFAFHLAHKTPRGPQRLIVRVDSLELEAIDLEIV